MNKNEIHISKKAQKDLEQIYDYTVKNWSLKQADIYYDDFEEVLSRILKNPEIGRNYREVNEKYFGVLVNNHIIFY